MLLHEPGRYPVAYFLLTDVAAGVLERAGHTTQHRDLRPMSWYPVRASGQSKQRAAWQHVDLPTHAEDLKGRVAFAWQTVDTCSKSASGSSVTREMPATGWTSALPASISLSVSAIRSSLTASALWSRTSPVFRAGRDRGLPRRRAAEAGARAERGLARRGPQPRPR
ncbi:DUF427 domain-containing protein [Streptomyces sp. Tu102]|uniref:DUF427 domain-containing protein n=1 Tax=Streptomyces TaxID=1883 RepID=UPI0027E4741D|nr:DUF427 domain-containing protein [Streptomyces sp. Tu102]